MQECTVVHAWSMVFRPSSRIVMGGGGGAIATIVELRGGDRCGLSHALCIHCAT